MNTPKTYPEKADFESVRDWIFDLDNTLYPHEINLFSQIDVNMTDYVSSFLSLDRVEARKLQKQYYRDHGTTLQGLMIHHDVDPNDFLKKAHAIDYSVLRPDPVLGDAIRALPGRKFIFTNGSVEHAEKTTAALGIRDDFDDIFDIVASEFTPKPAAPAYDRFLKRTGIDTKHAVMFEDLPRNLTMPKTLGMKTVLIVPPDMNYDLVEAFERPGADTAHIDYITEHISEFLLSVLSGIIDN